MALSLFCGGQPLAHADPDDPDQLPPHRRKWGTGICSAAFAEPLACCLATCFPCCMAYHIRKATLQKHPK